MTKEFSTDLRRMHHNLAADLVGATGGNPFPGVGRTDEVADLSERCK